MVWRHAFKVGKLVGQRVEGGTARFFILPLVDIAFFQGISSSFRFSPLISFPRYLPASALLFFLITCYKTFLGPPGGHASEGMS